MADTKTRPDASGSLLMDKAWENIQKKTFTKWVNSHLAKRGQKIEELTQEFKDGLKLLTFLEIIGNHTFTKYEKKPKIRIQSIQNVDIGLKFLRESKVNLIAISAEDIVDGNLKLILGMIWTIIQRFQISDISEEELSAKEALLLWCKKKTAGYRDCKVENFHTTWMDGMAFCALIHKHRPDLLNYDDLKKENARENLQLAFDIAEKYLNIPKLLDVEDMVDVARPDEHSVITYVAQYYHAFSSNKKQEVAGRRIGRLVDLEQSNEQMKQDFTVRAKELADWIANKTEQLKDRNFPNSLDGINNSINEFNDYRQNEKPPKGAEKLAVEALFNSIALKLRSNGREPFVPADGSSPADLQKLWDLLNQAEKDREDALRKELERQERLDLLNKRFNNKAAKLEAWIAAKQKYLAVDEVVDSLNAANEKLRHHETFYDEYAQSKGRLDELHELVNEMASLNDPNVDALKERTGKINENWTGLQGSADAKKQDLKKKLEIQQRIEELRFDFARQAKEYNRWAGATIDNVNHYSFGESLEDVQAYKGEMDADDAKVLQTSNEKKESLNKIWTEMQSLGVTDVKYTVLTMKDIENRHINVEDALKKRQEAYQVELKRQEEMEEKRKEFAKVAQEFVDHLASRKEQIRGLLSGGEPEELIATINSTFDNANPEKEKLDAIAALTSQMSAMGINENKHTEYNQNILQKRKDQFANSVAHEIALLIEEKETKAEYVAQAQEFVQWVNDTLPSLKERNFDNTLQGAQAKSAEFSQFKTGKKAEQSAKLPELDSLLRNIDALLKQNQRPAFVPPQGLALADIEKIWADFEAEERKKEDDVQAELARQEKIAFLVKRFNSEAEDIESWNSSKADYLAARENATSLFNAQFNLKQFDAYNAEVRNRSAALAQLQDLKNEIKELNYHDFAAVEARAAKVESAQAEQKQNAEAKNAFLQEQLKEQQEKENLRIQFARAAKEFNEWVKQSSETIRDYNFGFTLDSVTAYKDELTKSDAAYGTEITEKRGKVADLQKQLEAAGVTENRHTRLTSADIDSFVNLLNEELKKRQEAYETELQRQKNADEKRKEFAQKADALVGYLGSARQNLEKVEGSADEKTAKINEIHNNGAEAKTHLDAASSVDAELRSQSIYGNSHTKYTLPGLVSRNQLHENYVNSLVSAVGEEKELEERIKAQETELAAKEKVEALVIDFSKKANTLNQWLENVEDTLEDPIKATSVEDAEKFSTEHQQFEGQFQEKSTAHQELQSLAQQMTEANVTDFSGITMEDLTAKWNNVSSLAEARKKSVDEELDRQKANDAISQQFAEKAKETNAWLESEKNALASLSGSLEEQLAAVHAQTTKYDQEGKALLKSLEEVNEKVTQAKINNNKYTDLSFKGLQFQFEQLKSSMEKQDQLLSGEIVRQKNGDVTPEQLAEFKEVFQHFDKDGNGTLNRHEVKACLQSLGDEITDAELDKIFQEHNVQNNDMTFDKFAAFMVSKNKDTDSKAEILDSFKDLAGDKDFVTEEDLRKVMDNAKVDFLISKMPKYEGVENGYDYKKWTETAYSQ